ncbi:DNA/RNA helicase domain-containing protein [Saccharopolyspora sp. 5N102]|uniref:DNA/RNA helicase domain-containing protein n=1 Tax=Saccharopolyspora sp. 5N102 TaxID=3375155 RepID=UPI0037B44F65
MLGERLRHIRGSAADLLKDAEHGRLVKNLATAVGGRYDLDANHGEVGAWRNSLPLLLELLCTAGLGHIEVFLEYRLPYSPKRVDALLCGRHPDSGEASYVLIELKQWSRAKAVANGLVKVAGVENLQLPPVAQVRRYYQHLLDFTPSLARRGDPARAIAYLHNASRRDVTDLYNYEPHGFVRLFAADERKDLIAELLSLLDSDSDSRAASQQAATDLLGAEKAPARTLLKTAADSFEQRDEFVLLDEQQVAFNLVMDAVLQAERAGDRWAPEDKTVIIVRGGPGSGKSALAMSLITKLARNGKRVLHATGSKAFTETLRERVARGDQRISDMFGYFNTVPGRRDDLDVLVCDEAHRIRGGSPDRRALPGYDRRQINSLIDAAKVPVFLLDEHQVVRPNERGTPEHIKEAAEERGYDVHPVDLDGQFRCGGSALFDEWVLRLLGLSDEQAIRWSELVADTRDEYVVHTMPDARSLENWLLQRSSMFGGSARISAGFCWDWNPPERLNGKLVLAADIDVNGWHRPWNTPSGKSVPDAPPTSLWASDPRGFGQVGCVYTAQGFEYDWAGVIFGEDLVFRKGHGWRAQREKTKDPSLKDTSPELFDRLVRNTYKVLLTRGMQGLCLHSVDPETNEYLQHFAR